MFVTKSFPFRLNTTVFGITVANAFSMYKYRPARARLPGGHPPRGARPPLRTRRESAARHASAAASTHSCSSATWWDGRGGPMRAVLSAMTPLRLAGAARSAPTPTASSLCTLRDVQPRPSRDEANVLAPPPPGATEGRMRARVASRLAQQAGPEGHEAAQVNEAICEPPRATRCSAARMRPTTRFRARHVCSGCGARVG